MTLGEARTGGKLGQWFGSQPRLSEGFRCIGVGDNQPSLGCLSKGRSSVYDLNRVCSSHAAVLILANFDMLWLWVRSSANPSDDPSRWPLMRRSLW